MKILVAEDSPTVRRLVCTRLRVDGYEVIEALDGAQAYGMATSESPDALVLDTVEPAAVKIGLGPMTVFLSGVAIAFAALVAKVVFGHLWRPGSFWQRVRRGEWETIERTGFSQPGAGLMLGGEVGPR